MELNQEANAEAEMTTRAPPINKWVIGTRSTT